MSIKITLTEKEISDQPNNYLLGELVRNKLYESNKNNSFDHCNICGLKTPYLYSTNIERRVGYVEGSGQGCYQPIVCGK